MDYLSSTLAFISSSYQQKFSPGPILVEKSAEFVYFCDLDDPELNDIHRVEYKGEFYQRCFPFSPIHLCLIHTLFYSSSRSRGHIFGLIIRTWLSLVLRTIGCTRRDPRTYCWLCMALRVLGSWWGVGCYLVADPAQGIRFRSCGTYELIQERQPRLWIASRW